MIAYTAPLWISLPVLALVPLVAGACVAGNLLKHHAACRPAEAGTERPDDRKTGRPEDRKTKALALENPCAPPRRPRRREWPRRR